MHPGSIIIGMFIHFHPQPNLDLFVFSLRVPRYGAILEFLNFTCLLVTFILCLFCKPLLFIAPLLYVLIGFIADKDLNALAPFEVLFLVFAAAFALDEYTASVEHGWSGKCIHHNVFSTLLMKHLVYFANVSNKVTIL